MGALIAQKARFFPLPVAVLNNLIESTVAFGLNRVVVHWPISEQPIGIVDIWTNESRRTRIEDFIFRMSEGGFFVEVRRNPTDPTLKNCYLFDRKQPWQSEDCTAALRERIKRSEIQIVQNAPFQSNGEAITINPHIIRGWITASFPQSVRIHAIDFPEIRSKNKRSFRTVALVSCVLPSDISSSVFEALDLFKSRFGIDIALNPLPPQVSLWDRLTLHAPTLGAQKLLTRADLPALTELLRTALRWRTQGAARKVHDKHRKWFSIDQKKVLFREDLISFFKKRRTLGVRVAIPDITVSFEKRGYLGRKSRVPGAFYLNQPTPAWVFEFQLVRGALIPIREPYRDIVTNRHEYEPGEGALEEHKHYQKLKRNIQASSDYDVVEVLMHAVEFVTGDFIRRSGLGFLVHHDDESRRTLLQRKLEAEGFTIGRHTLVSRHKLFRLAKRLQDKRAFHLLPLVAAQLGDDSVVCLSEHRKCSLKPQRGTREQINQYILSAAIDPRRGSLPGFISDLLSSPTRIVDARTALRAYEEERSLARQIRSIIGMLSQDRELRTAVVKYISRGSSIAVVQGLSRYALIESDEKLVEGQKIVVRAKGFDLQREKFIFEFVRFV